MEALIGIATAALLLLLTQIRPAYAVAMALCMPMIHPAIGSGASFLGAYTPAMLFAGAVLRIVLRPIPHGEQRQFCFIDVAMILWIAFLPVSVLLNVNGEPGLVIDAAIRLAYMAFSFYASVRLLCLSYGASAFFRSFAVSMVVFGVFIAVVALARQENASAYVTRLTIGNTYIALSNFVTVALLHAIFVLFFMRESLSRLSLVVVLSGVPILFYAMLLCNTRGVVVALVLTTLLLLFRAMFSRRLTRGIGRRASIGMMSMGALAIVTAMLFPETWARMGDKFQDLTGGNGAFSGESEQTRLELFEVAIEMFIESPLVGHGIGTFEMAMNTYPHNLYLEVMAESGLVGLILLVVITFGAVSITLRYQSVYALFINALVVFQLLEALVSLSFWMHKNLFVFIAMAVAHHLFQLSPKARQPRHKRRQEPPGESILGAATA